MWVLEGVLGVADLALEVADLALEVADPLPRAPARDPTEEQCDFGFDADAA